MRTGHTQQNLELKHLVQNRGVDFDLEFSEVLISQIIQKLELISLCKAKFSGTILPLGTGDWKLSGILGASVDQPCSLTLAPVRTRIDIPVVRNFRRSLPEQSKNVLEREMHEDDNDEQLDNVIDILKIFSEALSLALPDYPRTKNVFTEIVDYGPPGVAALTDDSAKPFAVLATLKSRLK